MKHKVKLTQREKIEIWLELCDFSYNIMKQNLTQKQIQKRLLRMRQEQVKKNETLLKRMAEMKP